MKTLDRKLYLQKKKKRKLYLQHDPNSRKETHIVIIGIIR